MSKMSSSIAKMWRSIQIGVLIVPGLIFLIALIVMS